MPATITSRWVAAACIQALVVGPSGTSSANAYASSRVSKT
jgi:hypothetical protein